MTNSFAYLLVIHGSRNRKSQDAAVQLKQLLIAQFQPHNILSQQNYLNSSYSFIKSEVIGSSSSPKTPLIDIAALELASLSLSESLVNFATKAYNQGFKKVRVIPLFLVPGVHVTEDIPAEISLAIKQTNNRIAIELSPYLGKYSEMIELLEQKFAELSAKTRILIAHGSRLPGVSDYYLSLAGQLNAQIAYWSTNPSLSQQVKAQITTHGRKNIAIVPYFLFSGKITEAIAKEVSALQAEHPEVELVLGKPLGATPALVELIAQKF